MIRHLTERAGRLAGVLQQRRPPLVLCHCDIHAGNVLISDTGTRLHLIDRDEPALAPTERDLMLVGAGIGARWNHPPEAELFYQGHGPADVDPAAVAHYRYERTVVDVVLFLPGDPAPPLRPPPTGSRRWPPLAGRLGPGSVAQITRRTGDGI